MNMASTRIRKITTCISVLFLTAVLSVLLLPGTVFAGNKAARLKVSYFPQTGKEDVVNEEWSKNAYQFEVTMKTKTALKKQNYESAKILVPKSMFKKDGDAISFMLNMSACKKKNKEYPTKFYCQSHLWFELQVSGKKKKLSLYDELYKYKKASKFASVKEKGKYYVLTFKNIPVCRSIYDAETGSSFEKLTPDSTKYYLTPVLFYYCNFKHKGHGYVYLDEVSVKAKKTQTVTFNKVNYPRQIAFNQFYRKNLKVKLVKP